MVTKQALVVNPFIFCFVLAKKLMVTKRCSEGFLAASRFVLAKKLMVTKPQIHITINLRFYKM